MPLPWLLKLVIQLVQFALSDAPVFCVGSTAASEASIAVSIIPQLRVAPRVFINHPIPAQSFCVHTVTSEI